MATTMMTYGCAAPQSGATGTPNQSRAVGVVPGPPPTVPTTTSMTLVGARCTGDSCRCREPGRDDEEIPPPGEGSKRFEIRISADGGVASLALSVLGHVVAAASSGTEHREVCAYIDVPVGSSHDATFVAMESTSGSGVAPRLRIAEYGPKGPFWYDIVAVTCEGETGRCTRRAADDWSAAARQRKRGRLDPCGSAVVTKLVWETSGGQVARDGGLFRDFTARFTMDVKKFATQFAPGSPECLPK